MLDTQASVGIAVFPTHGSDVATLIQRADVAMYVAKGAQTGIETYSPEQDEYSPDRLSLAAELRRAMEREELVLHYQPKVDITSGGVGGVEVLVRWPHPAGGLLAPAEFIPLAEHRPDQAADPLRAGARPRPAPALEGPGPVADRGRQRVRAPARPARPPALVPGAGDHRDDADGQTRAGPAGPS